MRSGESFQAARSLDDCANALDDAQLKAMIAKADIDDLWKRARDKKGDTYMRLRALDTLQSDHPSEAAAAATLMAKLQKEQAAAVAAEKRRRGVTIGMSAEDVLASSWGKPRSINRQTTKHGTTEQWVYGAGNYLYFEDGKLTAIQN